MYIVLLHCDVMVKCCISSVAVNVGGKEWIVLVLVGVLAPVQVSPCPPQCRPCLWVPLAGQGPLGRWKTPTLETSTCA